MYRDDKSAVRARLDGARAGSFGGWRAWRVIVGGAALVAALVALIRA